LGLAPYEADREAITTAAARSLTKVRSFKPGANAKHWAALLDEIKDAKKHLLDDGLRSTYDEQVRSGSAPLVNTALPEQSPPEPEPAPTETTRGTAPVNPNMLPPGAGGAQMNTPDTSPAMNPISGGDANSGNPLPTSSLPSTPYTQYSAGPPGMPTTDYDASSADPGGSVPGNPLSAPNPGHGGIPTTGQQSPAAESGQTGAPYGAIPTNPAASPTQNHGDAWGANTPTAGQDPMAPNYGQTPSYGQNASPDPMAPNYDQTPSYGQAPSYGQTPTHDPMAPNQQPADSYSDPMAPNYQQPSDPYAQTPSHDPMAPSAGYDAYGQQGADPAYNPNQAYDPMAPTGANPLNYGAASSPQPQADQYGHVQADAYAGGMAYGASAAATGVVAPYEDPASSPGPGVKGRKPSLSTQRKQQALTTWGVAIGSLVFIALLGGGIYWAIGDRVETQEVAQPEPPAPSTPTATPTTPVVSPPVVKPPQQPVKPPPVDPKPTPPPPTDPGPGETVKPPMVDPPAPLDPGPKPGPFDPDPKPGPFDPSPTPEPMDPTPTPMPEVTTTPAEAKMLGESLQAAREALTQRDFATAYKEAEKAKELAKLPEHQAKAARVQELIDLYREFWDAVRKGMTMLTGGDTMTIGSTVVAIVESSADRLVIRHAGQNKRYTPKELPPGIARELAQRALNQNDPASQAVMGAIYAVDADPENVAKARAMWSQLDLGDFVKVLDDKYDNLAADVKK